MRAKRHPRIEVHTNGHQDLHGEPLRKAIGDNMIQARALLSKSVRTSLTEQDIDNVFADIAKSIKEAGGAT